jgi:hypothetical protein
VIRRCLDRAFSPTRSGKIELPRPFNRFAELCFGVRRRGFRTASSGALEIERAIESESGFKKWGLFDERLTKLFLLQPGFLGSGLRGRGELCPGGAGVQEQLLRPVDGRE